MDTRLFSNFAWTNSLSIIEALWSGNIVIPSMVERELKKVEHLRRSLQNSLNWVSVLACPDALMTQYLTLRSQGIGTGEAEALILAKENGGIVGSDNTRDVQSFCVSNGLSRIATPGTLYKAETEGLITEAQAQALWGHMVSKKWWNPVPNYSDAKSYFLTGVGRQVW